SNKQLTFTITIKNIGGATAYNISVTDYFPIGFSPNENTTIISNLANNSETTITVTSNITNETAFGVNDNYVKVTYYDDENNSYVVSNSSIVNLTEPKYPKLKVWKTLCNATTFNPNEMEPCDPLNSTDTIFDKNDTVVFKIKIRNIGEQKIYNVTAFDMLPPGFEPISPYDTTTQNITPNEFPVGSEMTYYIKAKITQNASVGRNLNQIHTSGYYYDCVSGTYKLTHDEGNVGVFVRIPADYPVLNVTKTGNVSGMAQGDTIRYTINITNTGNDTAYNVNVTDTLAGGFYFISLSGDNTTAPTNISGSGNTTIITFNVGNISVNQTKIVYIEAGSYNDVQAMELRANMVNATGCVNVTCNDRVTGSAEYWLNITSIK
ncbi:MAG: hypothetical protein CVT89_07435, partial [Candidatus Altiarchaeales archaeon HGW-Altiarchaeales-2]